MGSPPNLIGRGLIEEATGERIGFLDRVLMALPICVLMFVALAAVLLLLNKPEIRRIEDVTEYVRQERGELGKFSQAERNTLIAFGITVACWIFPDVLGAILIVILLPVMVDLVLVHAPEGVVALPALQLREIIGATAPDGCGPGPEGARMPGEPPSTGTGVLPAR